MGKIYIIDGNNICHMDKRSGKKTFSLTPLISIIKSLLDHGDDFVCIFDANVNYNLRKYDNLDEIEILNKLTKASAERFIIVTGGTSADPSILHEAENYNCCIFTQDNYTDHEDRYTWLKEQRRWRLLRGNITSDGTILMDQLNYWKIPLIHNIAPTVDGIIEVISKMVAPLANNELTPPAVKTNPRSGIFKENFVNVKNEIDGSMQSKSQAEYSKKTSAPTIGRGSENLLNKVLGGALVVLGTCAIIGAAISLDPPKGRD